MKTFNSFSELVAAARGGVGTLTGSKTIGSFNASDRAKWPETAEDFGLTQEESDRIEKLYPQFKQQLRDAKTTSDVYRVREDIEASGIFDGSTHIQKSMKEHLCDYSTQRFYSLYDEERKKLGHHDDRDWDMGASDFIPKGPQRALDISEI